MDTVSHGTPEAVGQWSWRLARVDAWMQRLVEDGKLAGLTTMVARRGRVAYLRCTGLADQGRGTAMALAASCASPR